MLKSIISSLFIFGVVFGRPSEEKVTLKLEVPEVSDKIVQFQQHADGQYSYTYANPLSSKSEVRSLDGTTNGVYKYLDSDGKIQSVEYSSDENGFQVKSATNLPEAPKVPELPKLEAPLPVSDTPEVAEARSKHLEALKLAEKSGGEGPSEIETTVVNPAPILSHPISFYGVPPSNVQVLPFSATPLVTLNYQIPGASFSYATYQAPILPNGFAFQLIGSNGAVYPQGVQENLVKEEAEDTVTIEAKNVKEEVPEKKE
nr:uncharacterized protein LOC111424769 [Onthophagus taurus]